MAAGSTLAAFNPEEGYSTSASGGPSLVLLGTTYPVFALAFDQSTQETALFRGFMPRNYTPGADLDVNIKWRAASGTSNAVRWDCTLRRLAGVDIASLSAGTSAGGATTNAPATAGDVTTTTLTLTSTALNSIAAGDEFQLEVTRVAANGADTLAADAQIIAVEVREAP